MTYEENQELQQKHQSAYDTSGMGFLFNMGIGMPQITHWTNAGLSKQMSFGLEAALLDGRLADRYLQRSYAGTRNIFGFMGGTTPSNMKGTFGYMPSMKKLKIGDEVIHHGIEMISEAAEKTNAGVDVSGDFLGRGYGFAKRKESQAVNFIREVLGGGDATQNTRLSNVLDKSSNSRAIREQIERANVVIPQEILNVKENISEKTNLIKKFSNEKDKVQTLIKQDKNLSGNLKKRGGNRVSASKLKDKKAKELTSSSKRKLSNDIKNLTKEKTILEEQGNKLVQEKKTLDEALGIKQKIDKGTFTKKNLQLDVTRSVQEIYGKNLDNFTDENLGYLYNAYEKMGRSEKILDPIIDVVQKEGFEKITSGETKTTIGKAVQSKITGKLNSEIAGIQKTLKNLKEGTEEFAKATKKIDSLKSTVEKVAKANYDDVANTVLRGNGLAKNLIQEGIEESATRLTTKTGMEAFFSNNVIRTLTGVGNLPVGNVLNFAGAITGMVASFRQANAVSNYITTALSRNVSDKNILKHGSVDHSLQKHLEHSDSNLQELYWTFQNRNTSAELRDQISPFYDSIKSKIDLDEFETM